MEELSHDKPHFPWEWNLSNGICLACFKKKWIEKKRNEPGSKLVVLGMVIPPLIGNPYNGAL